MVYYCFLYDASLKTISMYKSQDDLFSTFQFCLHNRLAYTQQNVTRYSDIVQELNQFVPSELDVTFIQPAFGNRTCALRNSPVLIIRHYV